MFKGKEYFINYPIFLNYKLKLDIMKFKFVKYLKSFHINERIIEIPFAMQSLSNIPKEAKILDLGCSESILSIEMASLGYKVIGIDFREYPYYHPNFNFIKGDILNLPFSAQEYDAVFSISTIEHIGIGSYKDPLNEDGDILVINQIKRVLKKNGLFVLTIPFGPPQVNSHCRIYDKDRVDKLLMDFYIKEIRYFLFEKNGNNIYWRESNPSEAACMNNPYAVCLIKAVLK